MYSLACPKFNPDALFAFAPTAPWPLGGAAPDPRLGAHVAVQGQHYLTAFERDPQGNTYLTCACGLRFHKDDAVRLDAPRQWEAAPKRRGMGVAGWIGLAALVAALAFAAWAVRG